MWSFLFFLYSVCFSVRSKEVIFPTVQSMMFGEDPLKHPAVEHCSPSEAALGESAPYLLCPAYTLLDRDRMTTAVTGFLSVPYDTVQASEWPFSA